MVMAVGGGVAVTTTVPCVETQLAGAAEVAVKV